MNYYEILEVSQNASPEVLKAAYRSLMQRYHPDRNPGNVEAAKHAVLVSQAYELLSDAGRRSAYDEQLRTQQRDQNDVLVAARRNNVVQAQVIAEREPKWFLWFLTLLVVFFIWVIWSIYGGRQSADTLSVSDEMLIGMIPSDTHSAIPATTGSVPSSRIISDFLQDVTVDLEPSDKAAAGDQVQRNYVLTIKKMDFVVGAFDAEKFMSFMADNREYIGRQLEEKLAKAQYDSLKKHNGETYLKQYILDSMDEITGNNRFEQYPAPGSGSSEYYGVVDVLLPDSYAVEAH